MYPGYRSKPGQRAAHLASSGHVCPLQSRHEPGTGLSGKTPLNYDQNLFRVISPSFQNMNNKGASTLKNNFFINKFKFNLQYG